MYIVTYAYPTHLHAHSMHTHTYCVHKDEDELYRTNQMFMALMCAIYPRIYVP